MPKIALFVILYFYTEVLFLLTLLHAVKPYFSEGLKCEKYICPLTNQILCQKLPQNVPTLITVCPNFALNFFTSNQNLNLLAHFFSYPTDKLCIMPNVAQVAKYCPMDAQILPKDFV